MNHSGPASYAASLESIKEARNVIAPYATVTPVVTSAYLDELTNRQLFFKCEGLQRGGAFKFRGACNAVFSLSDDQAKRGVVTHSSGNHGGALALAAKLRGISAHIVVPKTAPEVKVKAIRREGGQVVYSERSIEARVLACEDVQNKTQASLIPPYNFGPVISGQGTTALEILEQIPKHPDAIVVPVSGGGLLSGILIAVKAINPNIKVIAAEPTGTNNAADVSKSLAAGELITCPFPKTIADGLMGKLGDLTWPIIRDLVDGVITVSEEEILHATQLCCENLKVVVEPSGAVGLAAIMSKDFKSRAVFQDISSVCIVVTGGNVDLDARGLWDPSKWKPE